MIPQGGTIRNEPVQERQEPSLTWKLDFRKGRITGETNGLDAIKQAVFLILKTDRFRYLIHTFNYGNELSRLMGMSPSLVESEVNRYIREALLHDDRITAIENIRMEANGDSLLVSFRVVTDVGSFDWEVDVDV